jgi:GxxExxY protein
MEVHRHLGPGLLREAYEECLAVELQQLDIPFKRGEPLRFLYRGREVSSAGRLDFVVQQELIVIVLSLAEVSPVDIARLESLLRLSGMRHGILVNFNVATLRKGVHRVTVKRRAEPG